jgi:hypothetical protein
MERDYILVKGQGPLLITAPHTIKTIRGYKEHGCECGIRKIIHKLYNILGPEKCTIITWDYDLVKQYKIKGLGDPNYEDDILTSAWNDKLEEYRKKQKGFCLHIDLHGMKNKSSYYDIEIGMKPLEKKHKLLSEKIKMIINEELGNVHFSHTFKGIFGGYGSKENPTVSRQGVDLGLYSFQVELERSIRKKIQNDNMLLNKFARLLVRIFKRAKIEASKTLHLKTLEGIPISLILLLLIGIVNYKSNMGKLIVKKIKKILQN